MGCWEARPGLCHHGEQPAWPPRPVLLLWDPALLTARSGLGQLTLHS